MVHSGGIGYEDGKVCEGMAVQRVMDPKFNKDHEYTFNSVTVELVDDEIMLELHVPANLYRAEKLPLYYVGETIELGKGKYLGGLIETQTTKMKVKAEETGQLLPEDFKAHVVEEDDRVLVNAYFEENTMAQVLLYKENGDIVRYPVNTAPQKFQAMCVGTFQKADTREVDTFINKTGLSGTYNIKVLAQEGEDTYKIYEYAFYRRNDIKEICIPQNVTYIGEKAFAKCDSLKTIRLEITYEPSSWSSFWDSKCKAEILFGESW
jgi:arylsulfate sulfotransferase